MSLSVVLKETYRRHQPPIWSFVTCMSCAHNGRINIKYQYARINTLHVSVQILSISRLNQLNHLSPSDLVDLSVLFLKASLTLYHISNKNSQ